ncbi:hypothetical protein SUGI_0069680 [Cryptomeria japonica]|nr:hypothetical protein SUGI_0069680 [Cryptomeria japonica]
MNKLQETVFWQLLVTLCDNILTNRNMTYSDVEDSLEKVTKIFHFVHDKDMVPDFYRKKLADRPFSHSSNADYEKSMLAKLQFECGRQFTNKMEGMLTDWTLAMKTQSDYEEYLSQNPIHPCSGIEGNKIFLDLNLLSGVFLCLTLVQKKVN